MALNPSCLRLHRLYSLVFGQLAYTDAPERLTKGLARLAMSMGWQARGESAPRC
jgi:hypothetical protein